MSGQTQAIVHFAPSPHFPACTPLTTFPCFLSLALSLLIILDHCCWCCAVLHATTRFVSSLSLTLTGCPLITTLTHTPPCTDSCALSAVSAPALQRPRPSFRIEEQRRNLPVKVRSPLRAVPKCVTTTGPAWSIAPYSSPLRSWRRHARGIVLLVARPRPGCAVSDLAQYEQGCFLHTLRHSILHFAAASPRHPRPF